MHRSTKSTRLSMQSSFPQLVKHRVSGFSSLPPEVLFHRSFTVLCAIGHYEYLALGASLISTRFHVSRSTWIPPLPSDFRIRGFHLCGAFPMPFFYLLRSLQYSITPECTYPGLGSSISARRHFEIDFSFFPPAT